MDNSNGGCDSNSQQFLRVREAAALVGITEGTLRNKIADGSFTKKHGLRRFYGRCLIDRDVLLAALIAGDFDKRR